MSLAARLPVFHPYAGGYPGLGSQPVPTDSDAIDYLQRMAAVDASSDGVEVGVATAVDAFFAEAKELGVFSSIRASCVLAGARTLAGALVPLRDYGPELVDINSLPTPSVNNFGGSCGTYVDGVMLNECVGADAFQPRFSFDFGLVAGKQYAVEGRLAGDISEVSVRLGTTGTTLSYSASTGIISGTATTNTNHFVVVFNGTLAPTSVTIESLSIREVIAAPTNVADGFVEGDYSRTSGLTGDGATTYLDSGRAADDDPQNSNHQSVYVTSRGGTGKAYIGALSATFLRRIFVRSTGTILFYANDGPFLETSVWDGEAALHGVTRPAADARFAISSSTAYDDSVSSLEPGALNQYVFAQNNDGSADGFTNGTIAFYSIGTDVGGSAGLAALDTAVTNLINRLKFAILVGENPSGLDPDTIDYIVRGYEAGGSLE